MMASSAVGGHPARHETPEAANIASAGRGTWEEEQWLSRPQGQYSYIVAADLCKSIEGKTVVLSDLRPRERRSGVKAHLACKA
jgi:hypothetical protein